MGIAKYCRSRIMWPIALAILLILLTEYVVSYVILSRRALAWSEEMHCRGAFWFFPPEDTDAWRTKNYRCVRFYYPLITVDRWIGTDIHIAGEPDWRFTAPQSAADAAEPTAPIPNP
jgi:hypothetical protein